MAQTLYGFKKNFQQQVSIAQDTPHTANFQSS